MPEIMEGLDATPVEDSWDLLFNVPKPRMPLTAQERLDVAARCTAKFGHPVVEAMPGMLDLEIMHAVQFPHPKLEHAYESGCAEPWMSQILYSLLAASNERVVLETGGFTGQTSAWLAMALEKMGGGSLTAVDIDPARVSAIKERLDSLELTRATYNVVQHDILTYLPTVPDGTFGFAWIDDCHELPHVRTEVGLLWPKMKQGGIMCFHDVYGSFDLKRVVKAFGGYCLDLPRLGAAGGLGILQVGR